MNLMTCAEVDDHVVLVAAGTNAGKSLLAMYDLTELRLTQLAEGVRFDFRALCLSEIEGRQLLITFGTGCIKQWDLRECALVRDVEAAAVSQPESPVMCEALTGPALVWAERGDLHVVDARTYEPLRDAISAHSSHIQAIRCGRLEREVVVASAGWDGLVRLWSTTIWKPLGAIYVDYPVQDMQISENRLSVSPPVSEYWPPSLRGIVGPTLSYRTLPLQGPDVPRFPGRKMNSKPCLLPFA